jgi:hypothetical protein
MINQYILLNLNKRNWHDTFLHEVQLAAVIAEYEGEQQIWKIDVLEHKDDDYDQNTAIGCLLEIPTITSAGSQEE